VSSLPWEFGSSIELASREAMIPAVADKRFGAMRYLDHLPAPIISKQRVLRSEGGLRVISVGAVLEMV